MGTRLHLVSTSVGIVLITSLNAQITFEYEDLAVPGDVVERYVDTIPAFGPGGSGAAQVWVFTAAVPDETVITTVSTPATTPYASSFTGSNLAMTNDGVNFVYFNSTPATLISTGAAGDFLNDGQSLTVPFNPSLTAHQFPRNYGGQFSDTYAFEVVADGAAFSVQSVRLRHRGSVRDTTDAYGQISTPVGTYDVLRTKTTDFTTDSIWIRLFSFAPWTFVQATQDTLLSYTWQGKEAKLAVAEMTFDSLGAPARFTYTSLLPSITTGVAGRSGTAPSIHPVPAIEGFTVLAGEAGVYRTAELIAMDGKVLATRPFGAGDRLQLSTADRSPGVYFVRLWPADGDVPVLLRAVVQ
jgi:hypothetical protein